MWEFRQFLPLDPSGMWGIAFKILSGNDYCISLQDPARELLLY